MPFLKTFVSLFKAVFFTLAGSVVVFSDCVNITALFFMRCEQTCQVTINCG